jgi:hypothetical protein
VHHCFDGGVEGAVVVGVAGGNGEPVVGFVLDSGVVPAVADHDGLQVDFFGERERVVADQGVLGEEVSVWVSQSVR